MGTNATQTMNEFLYALDRLRRGQGLRAGRAGRHAADGDRRQLGVAPSTIPQLVAAAKAQPDKINVALPSTSARVVFEFFKEKSGAPLFGVPYKGSGTAMTEVMGGQVQLIVDTATALRGHVQSGKLKVIAITTLKSGEPPPGVKSVAEQGVDGFEMTPCTAPTRRAARPRRSSTGSTPRS